jgi:hypothetical protein
VRSMLRVAKSRSNDSAGRCRKSDLAAIAPGGSPQRKSCRFAHRLRSRSGRHSRIAGHDRSFESVPLNSNGSARYAILIMRHVTSGFGGSSP